MLIPSTPEKEALRIAVPFQVIDEALSARGIVPSLLHRSLVISTINQLAGQFVDEAVDHVAERLETLN